MSLHLQWLKHVLLSRFKGLGVGGPSFLSFEWAQLWWPYFTTRTTSGSVQQGINKQFWKQPALPTCNLEGAFPRSGLVDDITGVLPPAVSIQAANGVLRLISLGVEGSGMEQPVWQQPLEPQHARRVGSQHPARHHHRPPQALTHLLVNWLHCRRVWAGDRRAQVSSADILGTRKYVENVRTEKARGGGNVSTSVQDRRYSGGGRLVSVTSGDNYRVSGRQKQQSERGLEVLGMRYLWAMLYKKRWEHVMKVWKREKMSEQCTRISSKTEAGHNWEETSSFLSGNQRMFNSWTHSETKETHFRGQSYVVTWTEGGDFCILWVNFKTIGTAQSIRLSRKWKTTSEDNRGDGGGGCRDPFCRETWTML